MKNYTNEQFQKKFNKNNYLSKNYIKLMTGGKDNREDKRFFKCDMDCSLCGAKITDARESHNALPISDSRCCTKCNQEKILPARISSIFTK